MCDTIETLIKLVERADQATELGETVEARRQLARFVTDELVLSWATTPNAAGHKALAESTSANLWTCLYETIRRLGHQPLWRDAIASPACGLLADAIAVKASGDDLETAVIAAKILRRIVSSVSGDDGTVDARNGGVDAIGSSIASRLANNTVFRLFDEANVASEENRLVCRFLTNFSPSVVTHIFDDFCRSAADGDVLQFANDAAVVSLLSKFITLPEACRSAFQAALAGPLDSMEFAFATSSLATAMAHDDAACTTLKDLAMTVVGRLKGGAAFVKSSGCCNVLTLLEACATTVTGLSLLADGSVEEALTTALTYPQPASKVGALSVLAAMGSLRLAANDGDLAACRLLNNFDFFSRIVWPLRSSPDAEVRVALWNAVDKWCRLSGSQVTPAVAAVLVASDEREAAVREVQLKCAAFLTSVAAVAPLHDGLRKTFAAGVYNAGVAVGSTVQY